jgi:hypothetical protein
MAYFFAKSNQRRRKKNIEALEDGEASYRDNDSMLEHAAGFYKKLFGNEDSEGLKLDDTF